MSRLEHDSNILLELFKDNFTKLNESKCHLLVSWYEVGHIFLNIEDARLLEEYFSKLLGIEINLGSNLKIM